MGIYLSDNDHDCLTNMRIADDALLFAANSRGVLKKWGSGFILERRKSSATQARTSEKKLRLISFQQQEMTEIRNRIRAALATFHKYIEELTSKLHAQTSTSAFRRSGFPDDELRIRNIDTHKRARENDSVFHLVARN